MPIFGTPLPLSLLTWIVSFPFFATCKVWADLAHELFKSLLCNTTQKEEEEENNNTFTGNNYSFSQTILMATAAAIICRRTPIQ
jgi:hypothetical protein